MRRSLLGNIRLYWVINQTYTSDRFPRLSAIRAGWSSWLDKFEFLKHNRQSCGCADLGGGGSLYCTSEHMLEGLEGLGQ